MLKIYQRAARWRVVSAFLVILVIISGFLLIRWHEMNNLKVSIVGSQSTKIMGTLILKVWRTKGSALLSESNSGATYGRQLRVFPTPGFPLPIGVYYFSFTSSPTAQFKNFVRQVKYNTRGLPICIQIQYYGALINRRFTGKKRARSSLLALLRNYYKRPVVISATKQIIKSLKLTTNSGRNSGWQTVRIGKPNADDLYSTQITRKTSGWQTTGFLLNVCFQR